MPSGSRPARLIETPSPVERIVVKALVLDQFTDCGRLTFPCRPPRSDAPRPALPAPPPRGGVLVGPPFLWPPPPAGAPPPPAGGRGFPPPCPPPPGPSTGR